METLVPGRMPRAGLLLLSLLLCFGPETAGTITMKSLKTIVDHVNRYGGVAPDQYAFAVSLRHRKCRDPSHPTKYLSKSRLARMKATLSHNGGLYNPHHGKIVAARPRHVVTPQRNYTEHSEWRLLHGPDNPVARLKRRTYGQNSCLILFTYNSPCSSNCLRERGPYNIVQMTSDAFSAINNNYKAFVFQEIYYIDMARDVTRQALLEAWHRLRNVPLLRCRNNHCRDCAGGDTPNRPNPCLAGKR